VQQTSAGGGNFQISNIIIFIIISDTGVISAHWQIDGYMITLHVFFPGLSSSSSGGGFGYGGGSSGGYGGGSMSGGYGGTITKSTVSSTSSRRVY